jgi:hypothetical protein
MVNELQKNERRKLDFMIEWLTTNHLGNGGYPYDHDIIGDEVVIAEVDHDGAAKLSRYPISELLARYERAVQKRKAFGKEDHELTDVMYDEWPALINED